MKSEYRRKQEAKERESEALQQIKRRLGVRAPKPLRGAMQSPLVAKAWERRPRTAPTSDQIPASAPADDFMHAHKWKRGVRENVATVKEIRRKASKLHPPTIKALCNICPTKVSGPRRSPLPEGLSSQRHSMSALPLKADKGVGGSPQGVVHEGGTTTRVMDLMAMRLARMPLT